MESESFSFVRARVDDPKLNVVHSCQRRTEHPQPIALKLHFLFGVGCSIDNLNVPQRSVMIKWIEVDSGFTEDRVTRPLDSALVNRSLNSGLDLRFIPDWAEAQILKHQRDLLLRKMITPASRAGRIRLVPEQTGVIKEKVSCQTHQCVMRGDVFCMVVVPHCVLEFGEVPFALLFPCKSPVSIDGLFNNFWNGVWIIVVADPRLVSV